MNPQAPRRRPSAAVLLCVLLALGACGSPTDLRQRRENVCPQTNELGNYGCAELVVLPGDLPENAPPSYRWKVSGEGEDHEFEFLEQGEDPLPEQVEGLATLMSGLPGGQDTMTAPVVLVVRADTADPLPTGEPLSLAAVDTVRHTFRFAAVGERPDVDTLRFSLQPVEKD